MADHSKAIQDLTVDNDTLKKRIRELEAVEAEYRQMAEDLAMEQKRLCLRHHREQEAGLWTSRPI